MNRDWAEKNKEIQNLLGKEKTYKAGIEKLVELRTDLFFQFTCMMNGLPEEAFYKMPFAGAQGYHSKTIAYSFWHIFRIEDIVCHEMIAGDEQVLFAGKYAEKIGAQILTTGNELQGDEIVSFSEALNVKALYEYCKAVMDSSNEVLRGLTWADLKRKFTDEDKAKLHKTGSVSEDPDAVWLIDYWCGKDVRGLLKMPFSRHWIMHIEAAQRIKDKLCKLSH